MANSCEWLFENHSGVADAVVPGSFLVIASSGWVSSHRLIETESKTQRHQKVYTVHEYSIQKDRPESGPEASVAQTSSPDDRSLRELLHEHGFATRANPYRAVLDRVVLVE